MITDMLKTSASLPMNSTGERESVRRNEGNEFRGEFATVLAQVTGQEEKGTVTNTLENTAHEHDAEQTRPSQNTGAPRDTAEEAQTIQSERDASKADPAKEKVSHKTDELSQKTPSQERLKALADKLSEMTARQRIEKPGPDVKSGAALGVNDEKKEKQNGKAAAIKNQHRSVLRGKDVKLAAHRIAVKGPRDSVTKHQEPRTVENQRFWPEKKTGEQVRSLKMKALRSSTPSSDRGMSSHLHEIHVNLKNEPRDSLSGKAKTAAPELHETVLSKYEGSAKIIEIKPHYNSVQKADGHFDEIIRQFTLLLRKGGGEAKLLLQPEHLGSMKLRIQVDRGEVATSILVDNQAVKDLILSRLNILEESLLEHGFGLGSFEVGVKGEKGEGDTASGTARGNRSGVNGGEAALMEDDPVASQETARLPWISTRVNITV